MNIFTRRENIVLAILVPLLILALLIPQSTLDENELLILIFVVAPLGWLIATDPEKVKDEK